MSTFDKVKAIVVEQLCVDEAEVTIGGSHPFKVYLYIV